MILLSINIGPVALGVVVGCLGICAQVLPSFEVSSVKAHPWTGQGNTRVGVTFRGGTLTADHVALNDLIEFAYDLKDFQISGGPRWASRGLLAASDLYQVIAKAEGDTPPTERQFRTMLQTLLAERFQLKVHHVNKDLPVYNLVIAKGGSKLKESAPDTKTSLVIRGGLITRIQGMRVPLSRMVELQHYAGRPVIDKTGLTGTYDFNLEFTPEPLAAASPDAAKPELVGQSFFTALQQQLGLRLEPAIASYDTVVIDHAEKPTEN